MMSKDNLMNEAATSSHALTDFPSLMALKEQPGFLQALREHHPDQADFMQTASLAILRSVFQTRDPHRTTRDALDALTRQGYTPSEICQACAQAFYEGTDVFYLPTKGLHYRYLRNHHLAAYAIVLAFLVLLLTIELAPKSQANAVATVLVFEPVLAFFGVVLSTLFYYLLKRIVRAISSGT